MEIAVHRAILMEIWNHIRVYARYVIFHTKAIRKSRRFRAKFTFHHFSITITNMRVFLRGLVPTRFSSDSNVPRGSSTHFLPVVKLHKKLGRPIYPDHLTSANFALIDLDLGPNF